MDDDELTKETNILYEGNIIDIDAMKRLVNTQKNEENAFEAEFLELESQVAREAGKGFEVHKKATHAFVKLKYPELIIDGLYGQMLLLEVTCMGIEDGEAGSGLILTSKHLLQAQQLKKRFIEFRKNYVKPVDETITKECNLKGAQIDQFKRKRDDLSLEWREFNNQAKLCKKRMLNLCLKSLVSSFLEIVALSISFFAIEVFGAITPFVVAGLFVWKWFQIVDTFFLIIQFCKASPPSLATMQDFF
ncbi:MAG: hypothetical protein H0X51_00030 [Parachlamydiaceae bacterium]|nr:hypothetical protein [Parachlamydiaceae bacterium]